MKIRLEISFAEAITEEQEQACFDHALEQLSEGYREGELIVDSDEERAAVRGWWTRTVED